MMDNQNIEHKINEPIEQPKNEINKTEKAKEIEEDDFDFV